MLNLFVQNKLGVLQGLIVEQPVQFCPLWRTSTATPRHSDAVDGKGSV